MTKFSKILLFILMALFLLLWANSFAQQTSIIDTTKSIAQTIDATGWVLIFTGWLMYWMKKLDDTRVENKKKGIFEINIWLSSFVSDNIFEVPISMMACLVLLIFAPDIPKDLIDMNGKISNFMIGYAGSSILNGLITKGKKT